MAAVPCSFFPLNRSTLRFLDFALYTSLVELSALLAFGQAVGIAVANPLFDKYVG